MSWDSICHAWTESNKYVRAKVWDSWDWKENLHDKVTLDGSLQMIDGFGGGPSFGLFHSVLDLPATAVGKVFVEFSFPSTMFWWSHRHHPSESWHGRSCGSSRYHDSIPATSTPSRSGKGSFNEQCPVSFSASSMMLPAGSGFLRVAGLSGAAAVALGAYGAHHFAAEAKPEYKRIYDTANFYHFVHTLALAAVPLTRRPRLTGTLLISGMTVFCGTTYYHALTQEKGLRRFTPYGGILLILAWLSMVV